MDTAVEKHEISAHEARVFQCLRNATGWLTSGEVSKLATVAPRTARQHLLKLVRLGLLDQAEVFPGHRYKLSELASQ